MLTQTLGAGKAQVAVNADVNANQANTDALVYTGKGVPLTSHTETENLQGAGGTGGKAGTAGNIPAYAQTGTGNSKYAHKIDETNFGVDKTVTHSVIAPGGVNSQSVSVLVDKSVPAAELPIIKSAVSNAVGLNTKRGDTIAVNQIAFAPQPKTTTAAKPSPIMGYAKYGVVGLFSLLFLGFVARLLKRRENEAFMSGQPTWLRELESPRPLASLELGEAPQPTQVMQLQPPVSIAKRQIEDLVERDPDRVAQQVRAWMSED
jgi:flagellar M-ring protein FliF